MLSAQLEHDWKMKVYKKKVSSKEMTEQRGAAMLAKCCQLSPSQDQQKTAPAQVPSSAQPLPGTFDGPSTSAAASKAKPQNWAKNTTPNWANEETPEQTTQPGQRLQSKKKNKKEKAVAKVEVDDRSKCLLLHGVTEEKGEDCLRKVLRIFLAGTQTARMSTKDVISAQRYGLPREDKTRAILVRFASQDLCQLALADHKSFTIQRLQMTEYSSVNSQKIREAARAKYGHENVALWDGQVSVKSQGRKFAVRDFVDLNKDISELSEASDSPFEDSNDDQVDVHKNTLLVHGVGEEKGENCALKVLRIFQTHDATLRLTDIAEARRLGKPVNAKTRVIRVKFASHHQYKLTKSRQKQFRNSGFLVTEFSSSELLRIHDAAKAKYGAQNVILSDGKVLVKSQGRKFVIRDSEDLKKHISELSEATDSLYIENDGDRRYYLLLHGVSEQRGENCVTKVLNIFVTQQILLRPEHISEAYRLGMPIPGKTRAICVKFASFEPRNLVNSKKSKQKLRTAGLSVTEFSSPEVLRIRDAAKAKYGAKSVELSEDQVFVRHAGKKFIIQDMADLEKDISQLTQA